MSILNIKVNFTNGGNVTLSPKKLSAEAMVEINNLIIAQLMNNAPDYSEPSFKPEPVPVVEQQALDIGQPKIIIEQPVPKRVKRRDLSKYDMSSVLSQSEAHKLFDDYEFTLSDLLGSPMSRKSRVDGGVTRDNGGQRRLVCAVVEYIYVRNNNGKALESGELLEHFSELSGVEPKTVASYISMFCRLGILSKDHRLNDDGLSVYYLSKNFIKQAIKNK